MIYSEGDITALKFLCWCQYVDRHDLCRLFADDELDNLIRLGFAVVHPASGSLCLTQSGGEFLVGVMNGKVPSPSHSYHKSLIARRLRVSKLMITAYEAGIKVFTHKVDEIASSQSLYLSSVTRGKGSNPWGSSRVAALLHLGHVFYGIHIVYPGVGMTVLSTEMQTFHNHTARFRPTAQGLMFAGESYSSIMAEVDKVRPIKKNQIYYGQFYQKAQMPVHILSCDTAGAMQLKLMAIPNYREVITRAALGDGYIPPPKDAPPWDSFFDGLPFVMAADMNLRRIDSAIALAKERGYPKIALGALNEQGNAILDRRYMASGLADVLDLDPTTLSIALNGQTDLAKPPATQFLTEKGDVVNAPPIQAVRKT